jgi:hypothetical protein
MPLSARRCTRLLAHRCTSVFPKVSAFQAPSLVEFNIRKPWLKAARARVRSVLTLCTTWFRSLLSLVSFRAASARLTFGIRPPFCGPPFTKPWRKPLRNRPGGDPPGAATPPRLSPHVSRQINWREGDKCKLTLVNRRPADPAGPIYEKLTRTWGSCASGSSCSAQCAQQNTPFLLTTYLSSCTYKSKLQLCYSAAVSLSSDAATSSAAMRTFRTFSQCNVLRIRGHACSTHLITLLRRCMHLWLPAYLFCCVVLCRCSSLFSQHAITTPVMIPSPVVLFSASCLCPASAACWHVRPAALLLHTCHHARWHVHGRAMLPP